MKQLPLDKHAEADSQNPGTQGGKLLRSRPSMFQFLPRESDGSAGETEPSLTPPNVMNNGSAVLLKPLGATISKGSIGLIKRKCV